MFKSFKDKFGRDPKSKYKKKAIPFYGTELYPFFKKNLIKDFTWNYDIVVPWRQKFLTPTKDWLDIQIARDKIFLHPISVKPKQILFYLRRRWKKLPQKIEKDPWLNYNNVFINSIHNIYPYLKYIHPYVANKLTYRINSKEKLIKSIHVPFYLILLEYKFIPKFNQLESTALKRLLTHYSLKHNELLKLNPCFINWKLVNIYDIQYGLFRYVKVHPEWKLSYPSPQMIISKKLKNGVPIYLPNYIFSLKCLNNENSLNLTNWNKYNNLNCRFFNHYWPIWKSINPNHIIKSKDYKKGGEWYVINHKPKVYPGNKKNKLKFPQEFYINKSYYASYKEIDNMINLLKINPNNTYKVLKNIKNSNCLNYIKEDYYKHIFSQIKPMYYSLWYHYTI